MRRNRSRPLSSDPVVRAITKAHWTINSCELCLIRRRFVGDANLYLHGCRIPTIYYGPSNETAHAEVDNVSISLLEAVAKVYAVTAMEYCG